MHTTTQRYLARNRLQFRPGIAFAALAATCATLSLAVLTPAAMPHTDPGRVAQVAAARPGVEVAIVPATIEVVGIRASRTARAASPYLPAAYHPRG